MITNSFFIIFAYLLGSLSSAIIISRIMGLPDPRTQGSGNPGATNVLRFGGKKAAAFTLAGDAIKGLIPVLAAKLAGVSTDILAVTAIAAFLGHLFPVFFGFKGGKGVATALGAYLGISLTIGLMLLATWLLMARISKISSLSALVAAALAPLYVYFVLKETVFVYMAIFLSVVLIIRHKNNIKELIKGTEGRIDNEN